MNAIKNMDGGDWVFLVATMLISGAAILVAAEGWAELTTPAQVGALIVAMVTPLAAFFRRSPAG